MNGSPRLAFLKSISAAGIVAAVAVLLLMVQTFRIEGFGIWPIKYKGLEQKLEDAREQRDKAREKAKACEARHKTTKASVVRLEAAMEGVMEAARARQADYEKGKKRAADLQRKLDKQQVETRQSIDRLRAMANRPANPNCKVPRDLMRELEGL